MPISKDWFEELGGDSDEESPTPETNAVEILSFLRSHPDKAFRQSEIAAEIDVKRDSIGPTLVRLREQGRVDFRGKYWRVSDLDILPARKREDSPKGIFRLRVSSEFKYAFA
jgi:transcription initiation factor IIE alpha subunit